MCRRFSAHRLRCINTIRDRRLFQVECDHLHTMSEQRLEGRDCVDQCLVDLGLNLKGLLHGRGSGFGVRYE
ncbi:hypothetical protein CKO40_16670 [Halochromatium glycolicum]|uniref:Uncharacterized protein n=1 Tax=Halochromatium glycolicum TaxID=85075 RepID=A0AAJ0U7Y4_9GAMM|nr:hypothetical protein [Halochromatium glycolicum]